MVDIERFALGELFDILYEEVGGAFTQTGWEELIDDLHEEQMRLYNFLTPKLQLEDIDEPFEFHQWIVPERKLAIVRGFTPDVRQEMARDKSDSGWSDFIRDLERTHCHNTR